MRHIYKIYPDVPYHTIDESISKTKLKYARLCDEEGIYVGDVCHKMSIDDIALLYRQRSANATSVSHNDCVCFAVCFGNVGMMSIDDCANKTRIVNITSDDITDGQITLEDSTRYIIDKPSYSITFVVSGTASEYVQNYEIDLTIGEHPVPIVFSNIQWIGNQPTFEANKRYLIYIDGNLGIYTEI
jgi:hypothetical protein